MPDEVRFFMLSLYVLFATMVTTVQLGTDSVLRERSTKTLETLLASRLPDAAIFSGKVVAAVLFGYLSALFTVAVQATALKLSGQMVGLLELSNLGEALVLLGAPLVLATYLSTIAVFVGLRISDQRSAYLLTMVSASILALPFVLHIISIHLTTAWVAQALAVLAALDFVLLRLGVRLFRRERIMLYLQE